VSADRDNVVHLPRPRRRRNWLAQWPITLVLLGVGVAMAMIAMDSFRRGCVVLSASVLLAAFLRLLLPEDDAGMLAVRSRRVDVAILVGLGLGLAVLTFWVPPPS
jgi:multisubunit Na+/H+ antiporter MnhB subunit